MLPVNALQEASPILFSLANLPRKAAIDFALDSYNFPLKYYTVHVSEWKTLDKSMRNIPALKMTFYIP